MDRIDQHLEFMKQAADTPFGVGVANWLDELGVGNRVTRAALSGGRPNSKVVPTIRGADRSFDYMTPAPNPLNTTPQQAIALARSGQVAPRPLIGIRAPFPSAAFGSRSQDIHTLPKPTPVNVYKPK